MILKVTDGSKIFLISALAPWDTGGITGPPYLMSIGKTYLADVIFRTKSAWNSAKNGNFPVSKMNKHTPTAQTSEA